MPNHVLKYHLNFTTTISQDINNCILEAISNHNFELLKSLLNQKIDDLTLINALHAAIRITSSDSNLDRHGLFKITQLMAFNYLPELARSDDRLHYDESTSILNIVKEHAIKYKLLAIDIKMLNMLINTNKTLNISLMLDHIISHISKDYNYIFLKLFLNTKPTPNYLQEIYKELQEVFAKKLYTSITLMIKVTADLDNSLSILKSYLYYVGFNKHIDLKNILFKTIELLNNKKSQPIHIVNISECVLFLYSHTLLNTPTPLNEPNIENSRLFKTYKHYPNMSQNKLNCSI